jgi:alpha-tubulin suppressor-like RCC1 family protein
MASIDITKLRYTWRGQWTPGTVYNARDIVQYQNAAYVCLQTTPADYTIAFDNSLQTGSLYRANTPETVFNDKRPDLRADYWKLIIRGNTFKRGWMPHRTYQQGDIVRYGANLYMYVGNPGWGATATAAVDGSGRVVSITVTSGGSGYAVAPTVIISGGNQMQTNSSGATAYALVSAGSVTQIVVTNSGSNYISAPTVQLQVNSIRNTHPEDTNYWVQVFNNPNQDQNRMYAVATPNMQPLGWTRNNGDYPAPYVSEGSTVSFIDSLGVCYSAGGTGGGSSNANSYNTAGRGIYNSWVQGWQPTAFSFVDWLRSTDNQTTLGTTSLGSTVGLPSPNGLPPKCIQWIRQADKSWFLLNNGEVYFTGNQAYGEAGVNNGSTANYLYTQRCTNQSNVGWLNETLPNNFNNTKIIKIDATGVGAQQNLTSNFPTSVFALGADGSLWAWGTNTYGTLGLGQQVAGTGSPPTQQNLPTRIPALFFDNKKIVDFICFGYDRGSVLALDEDGDLWGWGADYTGELGLGSVQYSTSPNIRWTPTKIPFDFKRFGGIKKMSYYHHGNTSNQTVWARAAFILTFDGSLFGAGLFYGSAGPTTPNYDVTSQVVSRWTKFYNTAGTAKNIENFWVLGNEGYVVYMREKDTGLTYSFGIDQYGELGQGGGNAASATWPHLVGTWGYVKGPKNVVHITNNEADANSVNATSANNTLVVVEESGRIWGQGKNTKGSLSLGTTGQATWYTGQQSETGNVPNLLQPLYIPSGARIATAMGHGSYTYDIGVYITDDGQCMISGNDTPANVSYQGIQGQINGIWYYQNITTTNQYTAAQYDRYFMHTLLGD